MRQNIKPSPSPPPPPWKWKPPPDQLVSTILWYLAWCRAEAALLRKTFNEMQSNAMDITSFIMGTKISWGMGEFHRLLRRTWSLVSIMELLAIMNCVSFPLIAWPVGKWEIVKVLYFYYYDNTPHKLKNWNTARKNTHKRFLFIFALK